MWFLDVESRWMALLIILGHRALMASLKIRWKKFYSFSPGPSQGDSDRAEFRFAADPVF